MTARPTVQILMSVFCTALAYFAVGLPLAVLPGWVHHELGYSAAIAGLAISIQYIATIVSRGIVGPLSDTAGPRRSILIGFVCCAISGAVMIAAAHMEATPLPALAVLFGSRIALGLGESLIGTGSIAWGIGRAGPLHTGKIMSWNGIATYGAIAAGAPVGVWLIHAGGMAMVGIALLVTAALGLAFVLPQPPSGTIVADRMKFGAVFARVLPYGLALGAGAIGFGVISAFVALYYSERGWGDAWIALSGFGVAFVISRLLFLDSIARRGGLAVAFAFLAIEAAGLLLLWIAPVPALAILGAAVAGFGFAMLFPALGIIVVDLVPPQNRGTAIGAYSMFTDVALCVTGPIAGILAADAGYAAPFLFGGVASLLGLVLVFVLMRRQAAPRDTAARA